MALSRNACTNILRLLASDSERNALLALQLLDSRQARQDFLATLGAHLLTGRAPVRARVRTCLKGLAHAMSSGAPHYSTALQGLLDFGKDKEPDEAESHRAIQALHQVFGIGSLFLAFHTYRHKGFCGGIILRSGSPADINRMLESRVFQDSWGKSLALQNLNMEQLPEELAGFQDVEALGLSRNQLHSLPVFLQAFRRLRYLDLQNNNLSRFPGELLSLPRLECLDLRRNKLRMSWLEYLGHPEKKRFMVSLRNEIGFALDGLHPDDIALILANLAYESEAGLVLGLAGQGIREAPEAIFRMRRLRVLDLRNNPIALLPAWLLRMPELRAIYCDYGTEYNASFKSPQLDVCRDSQAPLPPPLFWPALSPEAWPGLAELPLELDFHEGEEGQGNA